MIRSVANTRTLCRSLASSSLAIALLLIASVAHAQFTSGVQGTVQDNSGGSIPSATVTLTNVDNKVSQSSTASDSGVFRFASLAPGNYQISATATGFSPARAAFTLSANETRDVPVTLSVGGVNTRVEVTAQQPILDTSDSRNQLTLDTAALEQLPLAARNPLALIGLAPGVSGLGAGTATNFNPENFVDASANGRGQNGNQYIVDGLDVTSSIRPGIVNLTPNADTIQEATVQTNVYTVDYGRASSIQTVITTRSGTDAYHGFAQRVLHLPGSSTRAASMARSRARAWLRYHTNNHILRSRRPRHPSHHKFFFFAGYEPYLSLSSNGSSNFRHLKTRPLWPSPTTVTVPTAPKFNCSTNTNPQT